jgi:hypothetical protein
MTVGHQPHQTGVQLLKKMSNLLKVNIVVEREQAEGRDREEYERNQRMDLLERELDHFRELTRF